MTTPNTRCELCSRLGEGSGSHSPDCSLVAEWAEFYLGKGHGEMLRLASANGVDRELNPDDLARALGVRTLQMTDAANRQGR